MDGQGEGILVLRMILRTVLRVRSFVDSRWETEEIDFVSIVFCVDIKSNIWHNSRSNTSTRFIHCEGACTADLI
jgi:hypothetical protein